MIQRVRLSLCTIAYACFLAACSASVSTGDGSTDTSRQGDTTLSDATGDRTTDTLIDHAIDTNTDGAPDTSTDTGPRCEPPSTMCNGSCVDTRNDPMHCGRCGAACAPDQECVSGRCETACRTGETRCDGRCVDTRNDPMHCGRCGNTCTGPGSLCASGTCVTDCRRTGAAPCPMGQVCDFTTGRCTAPDATCLLTGRFEPCGTQQCGPGTTCDPRGGGGCVPFGPCNAMDCEATGRCWGTECPCTRPSAACTPAPVSALSRSEFIRGLFGIDIDDACNVYGVTMISGPDYVRRMDPSGRMTQWQSITNLNMGEVAVQRSLQGTSSGSATSTIAFTYICCSSCGCVSSTPQGVGHVDMSSSTMPLPVVIPATTTSGTGPFGNYVLDTGPYGLAVSITSELYVGNVRANGDFYRYSPTDRAVTMVAMLPARVHASAPYDYRSMLVAVERGDLYLVDITGLAMPRRVGNLGSEVTSMRRDGFTGRFYATLRDRRLVSFAPDGTDIRTITTTSGLSRLALSPDGGLYVLSNLGEDVTPTITRLELPRMR